MKKLIIAAAALLVSVAAYGQGQVAINNRVVGTTVARFILQGVDPADATSSSIGAPDWTVSLLGGPVGTPIASMVPLDPATTLLRGAAGSAGAGFINAGAVTVPNVAAGSQADIVIRVSGPNGVTQNLGPFKTENLGGGVVTPPNLNFGNSPLAIVVPEPTTLALGALGLGALLAIRRRK